MEQEEGKITIPYKVILKRLWQDSNAGKLTIKEVRTILRYRFRLKEGSPTRILMEMKELGYINYNKRCCFLRINLKDLV